MAQKNLSPLPQDSLQSGVKEGIKTTGEDKDLQKKMEQQRRQARTFAKQQQIAERLAAATGQMSSSVQEATSAVEELRAAMEQISTGAQEAGGATQESMAAINQIVGNIKASAKGAAEALERGRAVQQLVNQNMRDIARMVEGVNLSAERNAESAALVAQLEKQAENIGNIVSTVVKIADQTNLLALNAAIEAARAGEHGKGFAVVADEVRTLAEISEKAANDIRELVNTIQGEVKVIAEAINQVAATARGEAGKGKEINDNLVRMSQGMDNVVKSSVEIDSLSMNLEKDALEFQKGASDIAAAAEEQAGAAEESLTAVEQQAKVMGDITSSAEELSEMADNLRTSTDINKSSEELAAASEELSAAVEETNKASQQIMEALNQISIGAQRQSKGADESGEAAANIDGMVKNVAEMARRSMEITGNLSDILVQNKVATDALIRGIGEALQSNQQNVQKIKELEVITRRIDKIVDTIVNVGIQTNMLAVSGAIEAARAGEFGKGFAVVASDIRNLAQDSTKNADQIKDLVKAIQDQVKMVIDDVVRVSESAAEEVKRAEKTTDDLVQIESDMKAVLKGTEVILQNADQISVAVGQARKAVEQIATAAQEASAATEEAASAAKQQAAGMREMARAIEEIAALADELQQV
ncbi:MAG: methyl-accepting chemotaxis protein [Bacillota bacterium]